MAASENTSVRDHAMGPNHRNGGASEPTAADWVKQLSDQASRLAHLEVELAKAELAAKGKRAGVGIGMFSGAGALA